jgi:hypothetical protein
MIWMKWYGTGAPFRPLYIFYILARRAAHVVAFAVDLLAALISYQV